MPEEGRRTDDVSKLLHDQKALDERKQALIADLLKQKEIAIREFDDKLAKLGYDAQESAKSRRSHHKKTATPKAAAQDKGKE